MSEKLVCLDVETTGLNCYRDTLLEVGVVIFDTETFNKVAAKSYVCPADVNWSGVDKKVYEMHTLSHVSAGYPRSLKLEIEMERQNNPSHSNNKIENRLIGFLEAYGVESGTPLVGSTIGFDRGFLEMFMPELNKFFHYRSIDVSGHQETIMRYMPWALDSKPEDRKIHRAIPDCEDTIKKYEWAVATMLKGKNVDESSRV